MLLEKEKTLDLSEYTEAAIEKSLFNTAFHHHLPIAAWRLPHQDKQHIIIDLSGKIRQVPLELETLMPGFVVSPFMSVTEPLHASFIHADLYFSSGKEKFSISTQPRYDVMPADLFIQTFFSYLRAPNTSVVHPPYFVQQHKPHINTNKAHFLELVGRAIHAIEAGHLQKVVPSRKKIIDLPAGFDIVDTFQKLCRAYPAAFVSAFSIPGVGTWIGASPEVLVSTFPQNDRKIFQTVALAGTQVRKENHALKDTAWRQKEIEEQAMVSRYIINCFKKIRLREFEENGPKTVAAGNLIHLRTDFTVDTKATHFPELASVMLQLLHPTSAVCGMPKEPAMAFLKQQEGYDREYFSGFQGPVNMAPDELHLFVNLRCMQLLNSQVALYSGAGVTIDSDPIREWKETEAKMSTLLKVISE